MPYVHEVGPEIGRRVFDASLYGIRQIKDLVATHGIQCDFEENGMLEAAMTDAQAARLEQHLATYRAMGLEATLLQGKALEAEIRSPRYVAALQFPYGGILNPAKLARGMKPVIERAGVEVRERSVVLHVTPGKVQRVETEMGEIRAPVLVLGLNGYAPKLGFFRDRVLPLCSYVIATAPLTPAQWASIGWSQR